MAKPNEKQPVLNETLSIIPIPEEPKTGLIFYDTAGNLALLRQGDQSHQRNVVVMDRANMPVCHFSYDTSKPTDPRIAPLFDAYRAANLGLVKEIQYIVTGVASMEAPTGSIPNLCKKQAALE